MAGFPPSWGGVVSLTLGFGAATAAAVSKLTIAGTEASVTWKLSVGRGGVGCGVGRGGVGGAGGAGRGRVGWGGVTFSAHTPLTPKTDFPYP